MNPAYTHMGLKLKELAKKQKIPTKEIAEKMGLTPQGVYNIYTRQTVGVSVLTSFCEAVGIKPEAIFNNEPRMAKFQPSDSVSNDSNYLLKYIEELEQRVAEQSKQIIEQSKQLAQQAQTIMALVEKLGKFDASGLLAGYDA